MKSTVPQDTWKEETKRTDAPPVTPTGGMEGLHQVKVAQAEPLNKESRTHQGPMTVLA